MVEMDKLIIVGTAAFCSPALPTTTPDGRAPDDDESPGTWSGGMGGMTGGAKGAKGGPGGNCSGGNE